MSSLRVSPTMSSPLTATTTMTKTFLTLIVLLSFSRLHATTIYVKPGGNGTGTSWANAIGNLKSAVNISAPGDVIWVATGTYYASTTGNTDSSFTLKSGVKIYGGFAGTEVALSQRADTTGSTCVLSGNIGSGLQSKHVINVPSSIDTSAHLNGFTIRDGYFAFSNTTGGGAGIYIDGGSPTLQNLIITNNKVVYTGNMTGSITGFAGGAGILTKGGNPRLTDVTITKNTSEIVFIQGGLTADGSFGGGGMAIVGGSPVLRKLSFSENTAITNVPNVRKAYGGALCVNNATDVRIDNSRFFRNISTIGGALYVNGPLTSTPAVTFVNAVIAKNYAINNYFGAVDVNTARVKFISSTLANNGYPQGSSVASPYALSVSGVVNMENSIFTGYSYNNSLANSITLNNCFWTYFPNFANFSGGNNIQSGLSIFADTLNDDFSLLPCSLPLNAGDNAFNTAATDLVGRPRVYGIIDMGAFEYQRPPILPDTIYVRKNTNQISTGGSSWADAFKELYTAQACNCNGVYPKNIWVAAGSYSPSAQGKQDASFIMRNGVRIYGGFAGNETRLDARDSNALTNNTILTGEMQQDNNDSNNSWSVVTALNVDSLSMLNGFTIRKGWHFGGGVLGGGGIFNKNAHVRYFNLVIEQCFDPFNGAGAVVEDSRVHFKNVIFRNNKSPFGAGCHVENAAYSASAGGTLFEQVKFLDNIATSQGGGLNARKCTPRLVDVEFRNNTATYYGGGFATNDAPAIMNHVRFVNNRVGISVAGNGGGGFVAGDQYGVTIMHDVLFANNSASRGGGMQSSFSGTASCIMNNVTFSNNWAHENAWTQKNGNAIQFNGGRTSMRNCIIDSVTNTVGDMYADNSPSIVSVRNCLFEGTRPSWTIDSGNNISLKDPMLVDTLAGNWSLKGCSPAIDAGDYTLRNPSITTDLANNPRRYNNSPVDIGAYEYQSANAVPLITTQPANVSAANNTAVSFSVAVAGTGYTYQWQVSTNGGSTWTNITPNGTTPTLTITNVDKTMNNYKYRCLIGNCVGQTTSNVVTLTVNNTSITNLANSEFISIYPNPATDHFYVKVIAKSAGKGLINVYDIVGREVATIPEIVAKGENMYRVSTDTWAAGVFTVLFSTISSQDNTERSLIRLVKSK